MLNISEIGNAQKLLTKAANLAHEVRQQLFEEEGLKTLAGCYSANAGQASMDINKKVPGIFRDQPGRLVARVTVFSNGHKTVERF